MEMWKRGRLREDDPLRVEDGDQHELQLPFLLEEIITEILFRLPAKSLGRFRCVSKFFLSLLSDPRFTKSHLDRYLQNGLYQAQKRRLICSTDKLYSVGFESILEKGEGTPCVMAIELDYPLKDKPNSSPEVDVDDNGEVDADDDGEVDVVDDCEVDADDDGEVDVDDDGEVDVDDDYQKNWVRIVGSCNGLVCISPATGVIFLFNPTTRESKRVPEFPQKFFPESEEDNLGAFGFGYDVVSDDYKVITLLCGIDVVVCVYSLKTDSWKHTTGPPYDFERVSIHTPGMLLNSAIHWVVTLRDDDRKHLITAFDMSNEKFWDMPLPDKADDCSHMCLDFVLGVLDESLCIANSCQGMHDDIWLMREYGVASSWTRFRIGLSYLFMSPLCAVTKEEVLLELDRRLVLYNLENKFSRKVEISGVDLRGRFEANTYVESLVSPNQYGTN